MRNVFCVIVLVGVFDENKFGGEGFIEWILGMMSFLFVFLLVIGNLCWNLGFFLLFI